MKIAMVSPYDFTWPGGVTAHVTQLARELGRNGHEVQVLAPHSPSRQNENDEPFVALGRSVPLPSGGSTARVSLSWWLYPKVRALLQREAFDIVHLHEPMAPILPLCVLEFSDAVNIGTFHASYKHNHLYRLSHPLIKRWHQRLDGGIAVSPAALRYVNSAFPGNYKIIPNGIDLDHFSTKAAPWPEYQDGKINILFVGRLEKRKGLRYLLDAFSRLKWDLPDIRLLVVGPGNPDKESHSVLGARGLKDVVFAGFVSDDDLPRYYASADIYCSPATGAESFGIVLAEAMAAGKPVVASDIEGYAGIVTHGQEGLLFPRKDTEALAHALGTLIRDPELRRKLGAQGRQSVEQYRWDRVASQVENYYHDRMRLTNGRTGKRADKRGHTSIR
ncbi:MAG: glycosyltransferase family 4 protein [Dehalococcoidia bacterium]|nr:glycosyltransferase family 4 protein [Dehalococcoidia bacterium]